MIMVVIFSFHLLDAALSDKRTNCQIERVNRERDRAIDGEQLAL